MPLTELMKEGSAHSQWLRILQIAIGAAAIALSVAVIAIPKLAPVTAMVIFAIVLFTVGVERIASGIGTAHFIIKGT